jgi:hypothetical protein
MDHQQIARASARRANTAAFSDRLFIGLCAVSFTLIAGCVAGALAAPFI